MSPCYNCITLPMCKSKVNNGDFFHLCILADTCPMLKKLLHKRDQPIITSTQGETNETLNDHIDRCIDLLSDSLLKGVNFNPGIDWGLHDNEK